MSGEPAPEGRGRRSRLRLLLQAEAVSIVVLLLGLLVFRTLAKEAGPHLVSEVKAGNKPLAPDFDRSSGRSSASAASRSEEKPPRCNRLERGPSVRYRYAHTGLPSTTRFLSSKT